MEDSENCDDIVVAIKGKRQRKKKEAQITPVEASNPSKKQKQDIDSILETTNAKKNKQRNGIEPTETEGVEKEVEMGKETRVSSRTFSIEDVQMIADRCMDLPVIEFFKQLRIHGLGVINKLHDDHLHQFNEKAFAIRQ